jgi:DNA-binding MurR/RpiR family transcriptional regulator
MEYDCANETSAPKRLKMKRLHRRRMKQTLQKIDSISRSRGNFMALMDQVALRYNRMSKTQQKIAHFLRESKQCLLFEPLAIFALKSGCSESSVVRFAQFLGYSGYSAMQNEMREELLCIVQDTAFTSGSARYDRAEDPFLVSAKASYDRIQATYARLDRSVFEKSCRILMEADNVLIIGYMDGFGVAAQMLHMLDVIRENVRLSRLLFETNEINRRLNSDTAALFFSFAPHYKYTYQLLGQAEQKECTSILITDSFVNPLAAMADYTLCVETQFDAETQCVDVAAPIHLIHRMIDYMASHYQKRIAAHRSNSLRRFEEYLD